MKCDCCKATVSVVDQRSLCFSCDLVQTFASIIEEQTDLNGDALIDLAGDLSEYVQARILEIRDEGKTETFLDDVAAGMVRTSKEH